MKKKLGLLLVLAALVAGGVWWVERATRPAEGAEPVDVTTKPVVAPDGATISGGLPELPQGDATADLVDPVTSATAGDGAAAARSAAVTVGDILAEPGDDHLKIAKKLAALVSDPAQPLEEREEALAHTLNLAAGHEAEVLTPLVKDPKLPGILTETILAEALNQSLRYQADLYLAALAVHKAPELQQAIRDHLAFLTGGEDRGPDPAAWRADLEAASKEWGE